MAPTKLLLFLLLPGLLLAQFTPPSGGGSGSGVSYCSAVSSPAGVTYICTPSPALSTYAAGTTLAFIPDVNGSGGATTVNANSLGAKPIKLADGSSNPTSSTLVAGTVYTLVYDGTVFRVSSAASGVPLFTSYNAGCQNNSPAASLSVPFTNNPTVACNATGETLTYGFFQYSAAPATAQTIQGQFTLPSSWSGSLYADVWWRAETDTAHSATWTIQTKCIAAGTVLLNPALNTADTVAHAPQGTILQPRVDTITMTNSVTGCSAGNLLYFAFGRSNADTLTGIADLISVTVRDR